MPLTIWQGLVVCVLSTLSMDVLTGLSLRLRLVAPLSPQLIGRWFASVARVQPLHADIARTAAVSHELAIALPIHYAIGAVLSALYVWGTYQLGWSSRSLVLALAFGLCRAAALAGDVSRDGLRPVWLEWPRGHEAVHQQPGEPRVLRSRHLDRRAPCRGGLNKRRRLVCWAAMNFDPTWLFLSLIPGGIGFVLFVYGRKQERWPQLVGGLIFMVYLYFTTSVLSLVATGTILGAVLW